LPPVVAELLVSAEDLARRALGDEEFSAAVADAAAAPDDLRTMVGVTA
jgi:hypothetical protein